MKIRFTGTRGIYKSTLYFPLNKEYYRASGFCGVKDSYSDKHLRHLYKKSRLSSILTELENLWENYSDSGGVSNHNEESTNIVKKGHFNIFQEDLAKLIGCKSNDIKAQEYESDCAKQIDSAKKFLHLARSNSSGTDTPVSFTC